jgi:signal transduction histidine kinase
MFGDLNPKQDEYVTDIHSSGLHLLALINDILDLTKVEAGRMELDLAPFAIEPLLASVLTLVRERAVRGRLTLSLEVPPDVGPLVADERKVRQIALNLVSNAVKFTKPGGHVTVSVAQNDTGTTIAVSDTGIGIAADDLDRIFAEFHQIRTAGESRFEGTGLGLALTKGLVLLHEGRIDVTSEPGEGSTFTVWLPARQPRND